MTANRYLPHIIFLLLLITNIFFWMQTHKVQASWSNVPPAPHLNKASLVTLGDKQFAYRIYALMLQNMGSIGGRDAPLKSYDYSKLQDWFILQDKLDPTADIVPMLAAHYFGAVNDPSKLNHIFDYLAIVGARPIGEKWRWLGHAVFLAKHVLKDNDKALELANILSINQNPDMADWARQMPVFILQEEGQSELAYKIMLNILISNADAMHPNEVNFMTDYICNTLLVDLPHTPKPDFCI